MAAPTEAFMAAPTAAQRVQMASAELIEVVDNIDCGKVFNEEDVAVARTTLEGIRNLNRSEGALNIATIADLTHRPVSLVRKALHQMNAK